MAKVVNSRNTKTQILAAYQDAIKERNTFESKVKQLETALKQAKKELSTAKSVVVSTPSSSITLGKGVKSILQKTEANSVEAIIKNLQSIHLNIGQAINKNAGFQVVEAETLTDLQSKIVEESGKINELFEIEVGEGQLDALITEYEKSRDQFNERLEEKRTSFQKDLEEKIKAFQEAKKNHGREMKELREEDNKVRQRENTEHKYNLQLDRNREDEVYSRKKKKLHQELNDMVEAKELLWEEEEQTIAEQEKILADYKEKYEELPQRLSSGLKKAEAEGANIIKRQSKVKMDLRQKEVEAEQKATDLKVSALKKTITNQDAEIKKLTAQLEKALQQAQNLAVKAIEGAANSSSFEAIRQIALEQAKHNGSKK